MDISFFGLAKTYIPQIPSIAKNSALALAGWSPNASVQDALTEIIVNAGRPILNNPAALLKSQTQCKVDPGIWGPMWIAKYTIPAPDLATEKYDGVLDVRTALLRAITHLGDGSEKFSMPETLDVEAEWTGYRKDASFISGRPDLPQIEQYRSMMKEVSPNSPTVLYFHGGAFCLMDPSTHRLTTSTLAQKTGGRCLSVRYRLAPQSPFPAALLDGLIAYLSLLSPPPNAFHAPVPASSIILAGDSSGANIATSLLLLLLTFRQLNITSLSFHNKVVELPTAVCGGLAITSPWLDVSRSLPSVHRNTPYDLLAPPSPDLSIPYPAFPPDTIWPASPPRVETYCLSSQIIHPLVSSLAAPSSLWQSTPPVYISVGWESMTDESEIVARRINAAGGTVVFDGYTGMPHAFSVMPWNRAGRRAMDSWAQFCVDAVKGRVVRRETGTWYDKFGEVREVKLAGLGMRDVVSGRKEDLSDEVVVVLMEKQKVWRVLLEEKLRGEWKESLC